MSAGEPDPADGPADRSLPHQPLQHVHVVGAGLIGASVGLALRRRGIRVTLEDSQQRHLDVAVAAGAGESHEPVSSVQLVVVCTPPAVAPSVILRSLRLLPECTVSDVAAIKSNLIAEVETIEAGADRFIGGHPMAGRELSGPEAADPDLFTGRSWVLTPTARTSPLALARARQLAQACGSVVEIRSPVVHDQSVAWVSHLPQLLSSALAAGLASAPAGSLRLAGPALRDMTRIAASDPRMWADIAAANAPFVVQALDDLAGRLAPLREALASGDAAVVAEAVTALLRSGNDQVRRIPGKHGGPGERYARVAVTISDRPGQLAQLLDAAAAASVNVEDLTVDHAPGAAAGTVELYVSAGQASAAETALRERGWRVSRPEE